MQNNPIYREIAEQVNAQRLSQMERSEKLCAKEGHANASDYYKREIQNIQNSMASG